LIGNQTVEAFGDELYAAFSQRQPVQPLTDRMPNLTIEDSYLIQQRMLKHRLEKGEKVVGKKMTLCPSALSKW
jgi:2-oxopent-4-enoate/cis-2-oxohex-4-enoate hydratase